MKPQFLTRLLPHLFPNIGTLVLLALLFGSYTAWAAPAAQSSLPAIIPYQGTLTTAAGQPVNSSTNLTFKLYAAPTGGTALWTEAHSAVPVSNGLFNVRLGTLNAIPTTVWSNPALYLGITVGSEAEMSPREQLGAVPVAMQATTALAVVDGGVKSRGLNLSSGTTCLSSHVTANMPGGNLAVTIPDLNLNFTLDNPAKVQVWIDGLAKLNQAATGEVDLNLVVDGVPKAASIGWNDLWFNVKGNRLLNLSTGSHSISIQGNSSNSGTLTVHGIGPYATCINYLVLGE